MTNRIAIEASYSDFKLIKSRSCAQVILELPIERAEAFLKAFGVPQPGAEKPVALALLHKPAEKPERPRKAFHELSRAQQAGILCADPQFQDWMACPQNETETVAEVRGICGVRSRSEIDGNPNAEVLWDNLVQAYRVETGQQAEMRG